jgi:hypothetical protein
MLFNLTTRKLFKCIEHGHAIYCKNDYGPAFGNGELYASEPFNGNNKCWSYGNGPGYKIEKDSQGISMMTNLKCDGFSTSYFTISELEVWEIIFDN